MSLIDDISKNLQSAASGLASIGGSALSTATSSVSSAVSSIKIPNVSLPQINIASVPSNLASAVSNIQVPQVNLPSLPSNLTSTLSNIQIPQVNLPQINLPSVNLSQINVPNTIQSIASIPANIVNPVGVVTTASNLITPKIQERIQESIKAPELILPTISQVGTTILGTKLYPASAACGSCPSPQEIMIANNIDPSKYMTQQQSQSLITQQSPSISQVPTLPSNGNRETITPYVYTPYSSEKSTISETQTVYASDVVGAMTSAINKFIGLDSTKKDPVSIAKNVLLSPAVNVITPIMTTTGAVYDATQIALFPKSSSVLQQQQTAAKEANEMVEKYNKAWGDAKQGGYVKTINGVETFVIPQGDVKAQKMYDDLVNLSNNANLKAAEAIELGKAYENISKEEEKRSFIGLYEGAEKYVGDTVTKKIFPTMYDTGEFLLKNIADPTVGKQIEANTGLLPSEHLQATLGGGLVKFTTTPEGDIIKTVYGMDENKALLDIPREIGGKLIDSTIKDKFLNSAAKNLGSFISRSPAAVLGNPAAVLGNIPFSIEVEATRAAWESPRDRPIMSAAMFALPGGLELAEAKGASLFASAATRGGGVGAVGRALSSPMAKAAWEAGKTTVGAVYIADLPQRITGYGITGGDLSKGEILKFTPIPGVDTSNRAIGKRLGSVVGSEIIPLMAGAGVVSIVKNPQQLSEITQGVRTTAQRIASKAPQSVKNAWIELNYRDVIPSGENIPTSGTSRGGFLDTVRDSYRRTTSAIENKIWRVTRGVTTEPHGSFTGEFVDVTPSTQARASSGGMSSSSRGGSTTSGAQSYSEYFNNARNSASTIYRNYGNQQSRLLIGSTREPAGLLTSGESKALVVSPKGGKLVVYERPITGAMGEPKVVGTGSYRVEIGADGTQRFVEIKRFATEPSQVITSNQPTRWTTTEGVKLQGRGARATVNARQDVITPRSGKTQLVEADVNTAHIQDSFVDPYGREYVAESSHTQNVINYNPGSNIATIDHEVVSVPLQYKGVDISKLPVKESTGVFASNNPYGAPAGTQVRIYDSVSSDGSVVRRVMMWQDTRVGMPRIEVVSESGTPQKSIAGALDRLVYQESSNVIGRNPFTLSDYPAEQTTITAERTMRTSPQRVVEIIEPRRVSSSSVRVINTPSEILPDDTTKSLVVMKQASNTPDIFRIGTRRAILTESPGGDMVSRTGSGVVSKRSILSPSTNEIYTMTRDGTVIISDATTGKYVGSYKSAPNDNINAVFEQMLTDPESVNPRNLESVVKIIRTRSGISKSNVGISGRGLTTEGIKRTSTTSQQPSVARSGGQTELLEGDVSNVQRQKVNDFLRRTSEFVEKTAKTKPSEGATLKTNQLSEGMQLTPDNERIISALSRDYQKYNTNILKRIAEGSRQTIDRIGVKNVLTPTDIGTIKQGMLAIMVINGILAQRGENLYPIIPQSSKSPTSVSEPTPSDGGERSRRTYISIFNDLFDKTNKIGETLQIDNTISQASLPNVKSDASNRFSVELKSPRELSIQSSPDEDRNKIITPFIITPQTSGKKDDSTTVVAPIVVITPSDDQTTSTTQIVTPITTDDSIVRTDEDTTTEQVPIYQPPTIPQTQIPTYPDTPTTPIEIITPDVPTIPDVPPPIIPDVIVPPPTGGELYLPSSGGGGGLGSGGVGYYGFTEYMQMRTPADIVAALIGYGRKSRSSQKSRGKKRLTKQLSISLDDLLKPPQHGGYASAWSVGSHAENAMANTMNRFAARLSDSPFPRNQQYNDKKQPSKKIMGSGKKNIAKKKSKKTVLVSKSSKRSHKKTSQRKVSTHAASMVKTSNKYLQKAKKRTQNWLVI